MKDFLEFLKLPPYLLSAVSIASGLLLFLPERVIELLFMSNFRTEYGFVIGAVFIIASSILAVLVMKSLYGIIKKKYDVFILKRTQTKFLIKLSEDKVQLINVFLQRKNHTVMLPMQDGLVIELRHYDVITPAGQTHAVSMLDPQINYFLQPWVIERIKESKELQKKFYF